jgi:tellurite resistance protein TehA-like permease
MSPSVSISLIFSVIGIVPAFVVVMLLKCSKDKAGLWIYGLLLIIIGAITIGVGTELLTNTEEWLPKQSKASLIDAGKKAIFHLKVWAFVFPGASIAFGVNLLSEYVLRPFKDSITPQAN